MLACRVVLSKPPTDWRTSGSGKAEESTFACGITLCGAGARIELGTEGGATSTAGANGFGVRLELGERVAQHPLPAPVALASGSNSVQRVAQHPLAAPVASARSGVGRGRARYNQSRSQASTRQEHHTRRASAKFSCFRHFCSPWRRSMSANRNLTYIKYNWRARSNMKPSCGRPKSLSAEKDRRCGCGFIAVSRMPAIGATPLLLCLMPRANNCPKPKFKLRHYRRLAGLEVGSCGVAYWRNCGQR